MTRERVQTPRTHGACPKCGRVLPVAAGMRSLLVAHVAFRSLFGTREPCLDADGTMTGREVAYGVHPSQALMHQAHVMDADSLWSDL